MGAQDSRKVVEQIYAAFATSDIKAILNLLTTDVEWYHPRKQDIPWGGRRRGHKQVAGFFKAIGDTIKVKKFKPRRFIVDGDSVSVEGIERARVKATGLTYKVKWVQVFKVKNGKVSEFREYTDTATIIDALKAT